MEVEEDAERLEASEERRDEAIVAQDMKVSSCRGAREKHPTVTEFVGRSGEDPFGRERRPRHWERRSAMERRAQKLLAEARMISRIVSSCIEVSVHQGARPGDAMLRLGEFSPQTHSPKEAWRR